MRGVWLGLGVFLMVVGCSGRSGTAPPPDAVTSSGSAGTVGRFALRGQVVVAHPPGTQDAVEQVRREAARRCPAGFVIRSIRTGDVPPNTGFLYKVQNYEAVVDCNPPPAGGGY